MPSKRIACPTLSRAMQNDALEHDNALRPELPATSEDDPLVAKECNPVQITLEANIPMAAYPVPPDQTMPTQEAGTARRVARSA